MDFKDFFNQKSEISIDLNSCTHFFYDEASEGISNFCIKASKYVFSSSIFLCLEEYSGEYEYDYDDDYAADMEEVCLR